MFACTLRIFVMLLSLTFCHDGSTVTRPTRLQRQMRADPFAGEAVLADLPSDYSSVVLLFGPKVRHLSISLSFSSLFINDLLRIYLGTLSILFSGTVLLTGFVSLSLFLSSLIGLCSGMHRASAER